MYTRRLSDSHFFLTGVVFAFADSANKAVRCDKPIEGKKTWLG